MTDETTKEREAPDHAFVIDDDDEGEDEVIFQEEHDAESGEDLHDSPKSQLSAEIDMPVRLQSERTRERTIRTVALVLIVISLLGLGLYGVYDRETLAPAFSHLFQSLGHHHGPQDEEGSGAYLVNDADAPFTQKEIQHMKNRLTPKEILTEEGTKKLLPRQFLHLHHMKTGGTTMDVLLRCATNRLHQLGYTVPFTSLHECSPTMYARCLKGEDSSCHKRFSNAAMASFCAPLRDLPAFSWTPSPQDEDEETTAPEQPEQPDHPVHAVTVLRHPVERVWSMYRFQTKNCYKCKTLKEVYEIIDSGKSTEEWGEHPEICAGQLQNHMTRNLIQHKMEGPDDENVQQAVDDIKSFFTIIGLTEDMNSTRAMVDKVFPWMAETVDGSDTRCQLTHSNKSPQNNRCGPGGTHWDLPPHPSEEDAELIRQHNQLDLQIYHAGERQHRLQKIALGLEEYP